jgi:hypothetical protein
LTSLTRTRLVPDQAGVITPVAVWWSEAAIQQGAEKPFFSSENFQHLQ